MVCADEGGHQRTVVNVLLAFHYNRWIKPTANPDKIEEELATQNYLLKKWYNQRYQSEYQQRMEWKIIEKGIMEAKNVSTESKPEP